jgi:hypothetical protein
MKCDQCNAMMVNKFYCHERDCPNEKKTWIDGQWILMIPCEECGDMVEENFLCEDCARWKYTESVEI